MSSPTRTPAVTWQVTGGPTRILDPANPAPGAYVYEIQFTTGNGAQGSVLVRESQIGDQAAVRAAIAGLAAQLDPVRTMTSTG